MTAQDRLIANCNSIISSLVTHSDPTPQDVTYNWINDDGTITAITYDNIAQYRARLEANVIMDPNYVATENNFSNDDKAKLDLLKVPVEMVEVAFDAKGTYIEGERWSEETTYCRVHQFTPGQFAVVSNTFNTVETKCELRIQPFQVHPDTGAITRGTVGYGYQNPNGFVHSTQSFGFCKEFGIAWGNSAWGSGTANLAGGCGFKVNSNNTVTKGFNTGNTAYATENTSNGQLAVYTHGDKVCFNIPNGNFTSFGSMYQSNATVTDWASANETTHDGTQTFIWRCVGKEVGDNHAGVLSMTTGVKAMRADGVGGATGSLIPGILADRNGIGFELEDGRQVYFSGASCVVRTSKTGGLVAGTLTATENILAGGVLGSGFSYNTSGHPAKEVDTFYFMTANYVFTKFRIEETSANVFKIVVLGSVDFTSKASADLRTYDGYCTVTGTDDKFIVASVRPVNYAPSYTVVYTNPLKDL